MMFGSVHRAKSMTGGPLNSRNHLFLERKLKSGEAPVVGLPESDINAIKCVPS